MADRSGLPWFKSLLTRLVLISVAVAAMSVGATAWLAVQLTTRAVQAERGQVLSDDADILRELSGYAATHTSWDSVLASVRRLSHTTDRRIALTTMDGRVIADSALSKTPLPSRVSATVDPLRVDTYTEPGAQLSGIDPRAAGPYKLSGPDSTRIKEWARRYAACATKTGVKVHSVHIPSGRTIITGVDLLYGKYLRSQCSPMQTSTQTKSEAEALRDLDLRMAPCFLSDEERYGVQFLGMTLIPGWPQDEISRLPEVSTEARNCIDNARRTQLDPYVAPRAALYLGSRGQQQTVIDLSLANKAKVVGVSGLVLAVTVLLTTLTAVRLIRPLHALTQAAQLPPDNHARVAVTTRDEVGILATAFNDLAERREHVERQRKAMISDIAHELRTPLTNIRAWLEATKEELLEPDPDLMDAVHGEALQLQRIIDDLQDLAAIDAGVLKLHREPVHVQELITQVCSSHRSRSEEAGVEMHLDIPKEDIWMDVDPVRTRQVLGNLLSNAIRHTPAHGTVTISAHKRDASVVLTVQDTGEGIASGDLRHVFDRFWRAEKSRNRRTGGSGLGLSIVRQLVEAHGGTVVVSSELGVGSVFTVRLPSDETEYAQVESGMA
ncbi:HAMP domain-containing sensor histidine kinase [Streptomyces sp. NPDC026665]|uniref:sensor histidine kinase n=1 Tax=Streptomyces sp. NPDC026665 TaxID=3154798 RepID=UPI0033E8EE21